MKGMALRSPPRCRSSLGGVGRFAGSSTCCATPTMRLAPAGSCSSAGTRVGLRTVPSSRLGAVGSGSISRFRLPAELLRSSSRRRQTQFSPRLIDATDLAEAMEPDRSRSRCPGPGRSICSKSLESERSVDLDRLDGARAGQEANEGAKVLKTAGSFGRNASMALELGGSAARKHWRWHCSTQHCSGRRGTSRCERRVRCARCGCGGSVVGGPGRGPDEVDEAFSPSMRSGRVDAEGPSVPGRLDVLR